MSANLSKPLRRCLPLRIALWVLIAVLLCLMFYFSGQDGSQSNSTSEPLARWLMPRLDLRLEKRDAKQTRVVLEISQRIVRKFAHFSEYALLAFLLCILLETYGLRASGLWAWLLTVLWAVGDEAHQFFVQARSADWWDVAVDGSGGLAGAVCACFVVGLLIRHRLRKAERLARSAQRNGEEETMRA